MAFNGALVDKGRRLYREALPDKVEGSTQMANITSAWFKCRLNLPQGVETDEATGARRRKVLRPSILIAKKNSDGELSGVKAKERIEIASAQLGTAVYEVIGDPTVLRKKRRVIGYEATIERVDEQPFGDVV